MTIKKIKVLETFHCFKIYLNNDEVVELIKKKNG